MGKSIETTDDILIGLMAVMDQHYWTLKSEKNEHEELLHVKDFSLSRFWGRFWGFIMALICDRMGDDVKKAQSKADCPKNSRIAWNLFYASDGMMELNCCISWDEIKTTMSPEEINAVDELFNKIILFPNGSVVNYDDASYGSFEGMAIYMRQLPHSLLNKEVDIVNHDDGITLISRNTKSQ